MSWNLIPSYLGGVQSATWQWFDMTQWQKTEKGDENKGQGIQAAVLLAPGRGAHQHRYLLAGAQALLMERLDPSWQSSIQLGDINLLLLAKALCRITVGSSPALLNLMWLNFFPSPLTFIPPAPHSSFCSYFLGFCDYTQSFHWVGGHTCQIAIATMYNATSIQETIQSVKEKRGLISEP